MEISVCWSLEVSEKFPELAICIGVINNVHVEKENAVDLLAFIGF